MDIDAALADIAAARSKDPLRPTTLIAPSHAAALHLRRRLAEQGAFAAVRFEPLPRVAELLGAGRLASEGRTPLARPIGDYVAQEVARASRPPLAQVRELPGYGRVLRQVFRRLRRAGITDPSAVSHDHPHLRETLRLYGEFRAVTSSFYDDQDLLDAATGAIMEGQAPLVELGDVYVVPPGARTAPAAAFIDALCADGRGRVVEASAGTCTIDLLLAPDPASEAREVVRLVLEALSAGTPLHEVAVFHGADAAYPAMLDETMRAAGLPCTRLPGTPLIELRAGRAVLALLRLPEQDYPRAPLIDALELGGRLVLPAGGGTVSARVTAWDRLSRDAGVTRTLDRWQRALATLRADRLAEREAVQDLSEGALRRIASEIDGADELRTVVSTLAVRLDALREAQPAQRFIETLKAIVHDYVAPDADGLTEVIEEIDQLGTIGSVGGSFSLSEFIPALRANLELAFRRERGLGQGVLVGDYRTAAGMRFQRVVLCGAREGALPAAPGEDTVIPDAAWRALRTQFPFIDDAASRSERALQDAAAAIAAARGGHLTWSAPAFEPNGARELFPSSLMVAAAAAHEPTVNTGTALRELGGRPWYRRTFSPLAVRLTGVALDAAEAGLRRSLEVLQSGRTVATEHPRHRAVALSRARAGDAFTEWDGNIGVRPDGAWLADGARVSPTGLETYAQCGFRYYCRSILRLRDVEEPEEQQLMDAAVRGSLIHRVLERFFRERLAEGRPALHEPWRDEDRARLLEILAEALAEAAERGQTGMDVFAGHEQRALGADLIEFLSEDEAFRVEHGAIPAFLEQPIPETPVAGLLLRGIVDRIDLSADGSAAWVIDYKSGSTGAYRDMGAQPLAGGTKLQLPAYLLALPPGVVRAEAFYWFITQAGGFERKSYAPTADLNERFELTLRAIADGIRDGAFPAVPGEYNSHFNTFEHCKYCEFDRICARRREEAFDEKRNDTAMLPWLFVEERANGTLD